MWKILLKLLGVIMSMFKPPIGSITIADAETLNGKSEGQLSVASAVSATGTNNDEFIISQTNEQSSAKIKLSNDGGTLDIIDGYGNKVEIDAGTILGTSVTSDIINITEGNEGSCDFTWDQSIEYCSLQTGFGLGRHGPILSTGELLLLGNGIVGSGRPTVWFDALSLYTSEDNKLLFDYNEVYHAGNLNISSFATTGDLTSKVTYHGSAASAPSEPAAGDEYYDTDDSKFYKYNGTDWIALN